MLVAVEGDTRVNNGIVKKAIKSKKEVFAQSEKVYDALDRKSWKGLYDRFRGAGVRDILIGSGFYPMTMVSGGIKVWGRINADGTVEYMSFLLYHRFDGENLVKVADVREDSLEQVVATFKEWLRPANEVTEQFTERLASMIYDNTLAVTSETITSEIKGCTDALQFKRG